MDKDALSVRITMTVIPVLNAASSHLRHKTFGEKFDLKFVKVRSV